MRNYKNITLDTKKTGIKPLNEHETFHLIQNTRRFYISSYGRVVEYRNGKYKLLQIDGIPFPEVRIQFVGRKKYQRTKVDRLVADEFLIPVFGKTYIYHKNGDIRNCRYSNLVFVSKEEYVYCLDAKIYHRDMRHVWNILDRQKYSIFAKFNNLEIRRDRYDFLRRCKDNNYWRHELYDNVTICPEWLDKDTGLQNFTDWAWRNIYEYDTPLELDKDILSFGDPKQYSPDNCCYIPKRFNAMFAEAKTENHGIVKKEYKNAKKAYVVCKNGRYSGKSFRNLDDARNYYYKIKADALDDMIKSEIEKGYMPMRIICALQQWADGWRNGRFRDLGY